MKKVKCIDNDSYIGILSLGKIYEVIEEDNSLGGNYYKILTDKNYEYYFLQEMFEVVGLINEPKIQTPIKPDHYKTKITPIEFIEANNLGFHEGNVVKYITRYKDKNGIEDLEKAKTYIEMLIEKLKRENA